MWKRRMALFGGGGRRWFAGEGGEGAGWRGAVLGHAYRGALVGGSASPRGAVGAARRASRLKPLPQKRCRVAAGAGGGASAATGGCAKSIAAKAPPTKAVPRGCGGWMRSFSRDRGLREKHRGYSLSH